MASTSGDGSAAPPEFDPRRLDAFLRARIPGLEGDGPPVLERISGGQSNPTFFLTYPNRRLVLRKKPPGELLPSAHAVDREARVLTALAGTGVPVPRVLVFHPEEPRIVAVLDWELSTLGHPLADLAFAVLAWRSAPEEYGGVLGLDLDALGMPREEEFVAHYTASRRTPAPRLTPFHVAFAQFRFAVIFEGIAARARSGTAAAADAAAVGELSRAYARRGMETIA